MISMPMIMTVVASQRLPHRRLCRPTSNGQVDATIVTAQMKAGRKGNRTHKVPIINRLSTRMTSRLRASSLGVVESIGAPAGRA